MHLATMTLTQPLLADIDVHVQDQDQELVPMHLATMTLTQPVLADVDVHVLDQIQEWSQSKFARWP